MGINLRTYFLYEISETDALLLCAQRPGYNNANQHQENRAEHILEAKIDLMLATYIAERKLERPPKLLGMFQGLPEGDMLYEKNGHRKLKNVWFAKTRYPGAVFISVSADENEFMQILDVDNFADNGWTKEDLHLPPKPLETTDFITEHDYDLGAIPDAYTFDLEDQRLRGESA